MPLVSIVIPACNPRFFTTALQSALEQSYEALEVLVCDDSQGQEIEEIVRTIGDQARVPVRYVRSPQKLGFQCNVLRAVELASGDYVKVLCDDDRLFVHCVEQQAKVLAAHAEVSLVLVQRLLADTEDFILPTRLSNARIAAVDTLFKGEDMLSMLDGRPVSFLGNFSAALMRRVDALKWLQALTQEGQGFMALLDLALFICLMRRGDMVMLSAAHAVERLHPDRLSKQASVQAASNVEWGWLQQMLKARSGESAPASGWVRYIEVSKAGEGARQWQELFLARVLSNWQTRYAGRVGSTAESYAEFYQQWLACRRFTQVQQRLLPQTISAWPSQPQIVPIVLDVEGDASAVQRTLDSLSAQLYAPMATLLVSDAQVGAVEHRIQVPMQGLWPAQLNGLLGALEGADWFYLLRAGDELSESALLVLAERIAVLPGLLCVYSDEGALQDEGAGEPVFKPDFNLDLLRSYPYVGRALAFQRQVVLDLGGFEASFAELAPHDLLWRLVESSGPQVIGHIAEIQLQSSFSFAQWLSLPQVIEQNSRVVAAHLQRLGVAHQIRHDDMPLLNRVDYLHAERPLVSIIIVAGADLLALQGCVESILERTTYTAYEILIVSAPSSNAQMRNWLDAMASMEVSMLRVVEAGAAGGSSALINFAATQAQGEYLLLLAADSRVDQGDWLAEMLQHALRPEVAIVGAKILDTRGSVLSAGLVLGAGNTAAPAFLGADGWAKGYLQRLQVVQNWSAVSRDCLMVRRTVFDSVGALDGQRSGAGLDELELCLSVGAEGYLVVWTPYARLLRTQSLLDTRQSESTPDAVLDFCERWLPKVVSDPAYNPNLSLAHADFALETSLHGSWNPLCARALPSVMGLPINDTAVGHYRVSKPFSELEAAGRIVGRVNYETPSTVQLARMNPDVIVLQLRHSEESVRDVERIARFSNARRIFEIDDYVISAPKKNAHARNKPVDIEQHLRRGIGLCDRLVVTTSALANALSDMHRDIRVVPNMLAVDMWSGLVSHRGTSSKPRVGWGGGTSHGGDLEIIADVVRELADQVEWVFFGMCPQSLRPYIHEFHPSVDLNIYPAKLASLNLDLALAPLEFHLFNDCKSNLRLLEYGACGYPVICTDTEAYRGYLPCTRIKSNSTEEWLQAIRMHLADPAASYRMGDELREAVLRDFVLRADNLQHWVWGWLAD